MTNTPKQPLHMVKDHGKLGENPDGTRLYTSVPMALARDSRLDPRDIGVACFVWSHDTTYKQSAKAVAAAMGISRGTVDRALSSLEKHGWLRREKTDPNNPRYEVWHRNMSNTPWTCPDMEHADDNQPCSKIEHTPTPSEGVCTKTGHGYALKQGMGMPQNEAWVCTKIEHDSSTREVNTSSSTSSAMATSTSQTGASNGSGPAMDERDYLIADSYRGIEPAIGNETPPIDIGGVEGVETTSVGLVPLVGDDPFSEPLSGFTYSTDNADSSLGTVDPFWEPPEVEAKHQREAEQARIDFRAYLDTRPVRTGSPFED